MRTLRGHTDAVTCVAALPDGRCVSGSLDDALHMWNTHDAVCDATLMGHTHYVWCVCALPDGRVVSGSQDGTVRVWGAAAPHPCEHVFTNYSKDYNGEPKLVPVSAVGILPGNRIVCALSNSPSYEPLCFWSIDAGALERTVALPEERRNRLLPGTRVVYNLDRLGMTDKIWNPAGGAWAPALLAASAADASPEEAAYMEAFATFARPLPPGVDRGALEACVARTHMDLEAREFAVSADGGHVAVVTHGTTVHFFELMPAAERV
jgi:WD40 repeat protein